MSSNRRRIASKGWISALIGVGLIAATLAGLSVAWEARQRRSAMVRLFEANASIFTEVLGDAATQSARAYEELETSVAKRLQDLVSVLETWDQEGKLTPARLQRFNRMPDFLRIQVLNPDGRLFASNRMPGPMRMGPGMMRMARDMMRMGPGMMRMEDEKRRDTEPPPEMAPPQILDDPNVEDVLRGDRESAVLGFNRTPGMMGGSMYGVVQRRKRGGAIVAFVEAQEMARLRSTTSRDALLEKAQNTDGVLAVSWTALKSASSPVPDFRWEWGEVEGKPAFIGIRTLQDTDGQPAELRVALDATAISALERSAWSQGMLRVALVAFATLAATGFLFARQNMRLLTEERDRILEDVKRLEEETRRAEKLTAMGELAAGVAHEIRNPLNAIGMVAQRLGREFRPTEDEEEYQELIDVLRGESARVEDVVEQFLRFARPPKMDPTAGDLAETVRESADRLDAFAASNDVEIDVRAPETLPWFFDGRQLSQVVENLIRNAIEAQPNGGLVRVELESDDGGPIRLLIEDRGEGIPEDRIERVFDLYFTTKPNGTGLGLPIVHQIVAEHGGTIHLTSAPGKGTRVEITFPTRKSSEKAAG